MKKFGLVIFGVALIVGVVMANVFSFGRLSERIFNVSVNFSGVKGSGHVVTETRDVAEFSGIDVGGIYKVDVTAQKDFAVVVEADDNLLPLIRTEVDGDTLKIESNDRIKPQSGQILVHVYAPDIDSLDVSGAANVTVKDLSNDSLSVSSSGASRIDLAGSTSNLTIDVSGGSKVFADTLNAVDATVDASGASNVTLNVSGELTSDASGASKVFYSGTPSSVKKNTSGAGRISQK